MRVDKSSSRLHHKFLKFSGAKAYFGSILIYKLQFLFCQNFQHVRGAATHQPFQVFCHLRQYKGILNTILLKLLRFLDGNCHQCVCKVDIIFIIIIIHICLQYSDLEEKICTPTQLHPKPETSALVFGKYFTDHMLEVEWDSAKGWAKPVISPLHDLKLHPGAKVLHYAIEVCECV